MRIQDLSGKTVCILGYGREGKAVVAAMEHYAPTAELTIADKNESVKMTNKKHGKQLGTGWLSNLEKFDVIVKSPGIPFVPELEPHRAKVTNATQIFLDSVRETGATVIGITGSKGKSTTASLIYGILKAAKRDVYLIGNIGDPAINHLADAKSHTIFVQEMSSYQLSELTVSPHIAVITSFFPEHLDYHGSVEAYLEAKKNITRFQTKDDVVYFDATSDGAKAIAKMSAGTKVPYSTETAKIKREHMNLIGKHNERNIAAALAVTLSEEFSVEPAVAVEAIQEFKGLEHRLEYCSEKLGIRWYEDSISTTPESTIAGIDALNNEIGTILLGGLDRGYDFTELGTKIAESSVSHVILFPESGARIRAAIENAKATVQFHETESMTEAVRIAAEVTPKGTVCLLSPASPSYNLYKNFEERGNKFKEAVSAL